MADYYLPRLRRELAEQAEQLLGVKNVVVENANDKFDADLAIPVFAFSPQRQVAPNELAAELAEKLEHEDITKIEPSGGFVNIWLKPEKLAARVVDITKNDGYGLHDSMKGQEVVIEHTDPNPFKELHIGHIYSNTVGESLARLHEAAGATVHRISYHGDVGLHIAKAVWALGDSISWQKENLTDDIKSIGSYYARGAKEFDEDEDTAFQIRELNKKIYERSDESVNYVYDWGKEMSFAYFDEVYEKYDTPVFERRFLESQTGPRGVEIVKANLGQVFEDSDGAVVYRDQEEHTRVFISGEGLPTYEAKDLGLAYLKKEVYPQASQYLIITANEINAYFNIVLRALEQIDPGMAQKTRHLSHGLVKLPSGKMSSRTGEVVLAEELLGDVGRFVSKRSPDALSAHDNALAAVKYAFLKQNIGGDIVYDAEESVNLEGQTGPYVQYAAVRMQSILDKVKASGNLEDYDWQEEKALLLLVAKYPEITELAIKELAPHRIAQYVYELAKEFNRYYESTPVKDAPNQAKAARLEVVRSCLTVIKNGLGLLNIPVPSKM